MVEENPQSADFWSILDEAAAIVESWPEWKQRYEVAVYGEAGAAGE